MVGYEHESRTASAGSATLRIGVVGPSPDAVGGQAAQARALVAGLRGDRSSVLMLPITVAFPPGLRWARRVPYLRTVLNQLLYFPGLVRLAGVDVVHIFSASYWSFLLASVPAMLVARLLGKRVILNYHSGEAPDHLQRWGLLVHPWLRLAHAIVVPSEFLRQVFASFGYTVDVVLNVVDVSQFEFRARPQVAPRLLSVRHLEPLYGVEDVVAAFAHVRATLPDATLTIAGTGRCAKQLEERVRSLDLQSSVRFVGRVDGRALAQLHAEADILINASRIDNQPVSLLEAMASGLTIVTTGPGDIPCMIGRNERGVLVAEGDIQGLAGAVVALIQDPERAARLAQAARADVARYSWNQIRDRWTVIYAAGSVGADASHCAV